MTIFTVLAVAIVIVYMLFGSRVIGITLMSGILVSALLTAAVGEIGLLPGAILGLIFGFYLSLRANFVS